MDIGASGAVSSAKGMGITSVTKNGTAGNYTIQLTNRFAQLLNIQAQVIDDAISSISRIQVLMDPATMQASIKSNGQIVVQCIAPTSSSDTTPVAANPASGAQLQFRIVMRNASQGPKD